DALTALDDGLAALDQRVDGLENGGSDTASTAVASSRTAATSPSADAKTPDAEDVDATATAVASEDGGEHGSGGTITAANTDAPRRVTAETTTASDDSGTAQSTAANAHTMSQANAYTDTRITQAVAVPMAAIDDLRTEVGKRFIEQDERIDRM